MRRSDSRELRLRQCERLAEQEPASLHDYGELGSYIAINPMADERDLLLRLGVDPASCIKVDCYWKYDDDVYFVQVHTTEYDRRDEGLWSRQSAGEPPRVNLVAVIAASAITRDILHEVLRRFIASGLENIPLLDHLRRLDGLE